MLHIPDSGEHGHHSLLQYLKFSINLVSSTISLLPTRNNSLSSLPQAISFWLKKIRCFKSMVENSNFSKKSTSYPQFFNLVLIQLHADYVILVFKLRNPHLMLLDMMGSTKCCKSKFCVIYFFPLSSA